MILHTLVVPHGKGTSASSLNHCLQLSGFLLDPQLGMDLSHGSWDPETVSLFLPSSGICICTSSPVSTRF